ncbi:MAG: hypothetical protein SFY95_01605 [Planctomycetota bacterium]|nr:hypothetical protein [Planctomycetota bacterium]
MSSERTLTWTLLLSKWTEFARAAVALPAGGDGARWKASVPAVIGLQALTHALGELDMVCAGSGGAGGAGGADDYEVGQDRAEVMIRQYTRDLHEIWKGEAMPGGMAELVSDARLALSATREAGLELVSPLPRMVAPAPSGARAGARGSAIAEGFDGEVWILKPGTVVFAGVVAAFVKTRTGRPAGAGVVRAVASALGLSRDGQAWPASRRVPGMRQVYRQFEDGQPARDVIVPMRDELPAGFPMLVEWVSKGRVAAEFPQAEVLAWTQSQERTLAGRTLPTIEPQAPLEP